MKIYCHAKGRKPLVKAISEFTGEKAKYLFMPTCAYEIGSYLVDKEGNVECGEDADEISVNELKDFLTEKGFNTEEEMHEVIAQETEETANAGEEPPEGNLEMTVVAMPIEKVNVENLQKILAAKGRLICKALNLHQVNVSESGEKVFFPWLMGETSNDEREACFKLIEAVCKMSREQKRITAKAKEVENEKYAFRCFLLRLGFIGEEYKKDRKVLLKNFTGSSAFKTVKKKEEESHAVSE